MRRGLSRVQDTSLMWTDLYIDGRFKEDDGKPCLVYNAPLEATAVARITATGETDSIVYRAPLSSRSDTTELERAPPW